MERRIIKETHLTYPEARELLEKRIREKEFGVIIAVDKTLNYLRLFGDRDPVKARETVNRLVGLGLDEEVAVAVVNVCPSTPGEVRSVLSMRREASFSEEAVQRILEEVRDYCTST